MTRQRWEIWTEDKCYLLSCFTLYGDNNGEVKAWLPLALAECIPINKRRCGDQSGVIVNVFDLDV